MTAQLKNISNSFTFSTFYFKGVTVDGTCPEWQSYAGTSIVLPPGDTYMSKITAAFEIFDFTTGDSFQKLYTCTNPGAVPYLAAGLLSGVAFSYPCDGDTWRVFQCNGFPVFCVNCKLNCVPSVVCPGVSGPSYDPNPAYIFNPCQQCNTHAAASAAINFQFNHKILYPQFNSLSVTPGRSFIGVTVNITHAGVVACAAVPAGSPVSTVLYIRQAGVGATAFVTNAIINLYLGSLNPQTNYDVYCYTQDLSVNAMPLATALQTKMQTTTLCCKIIQFSTTYPIIPELTTSPLPVFQFTLNSVPMTTSIIVLTLTIASCPASLGMGPSQPARLQATYVYPARFVFNPTSTSLSGSFVVQGYQGCYVVKAKTDNGDFYQNATTFIVIQNQNLRAPSAPRLSTVQFSNDGMSLLYNFGSTTNKIAPVNATSFPCSFLVRFPGSTAASCSWVSTTQLVASLSSQSSKLPNVGDGASVFGSLVSAACIPTTNCATYPTSLLMYTNISAPATPPRPQVSLLSATTFR